MKVTRNEIDFADIFRFAEKKFGVDWNDANDLFFSGVLDYGRYNDIEIKEAEMWADDPLSGLSNDDKKAWRIIIAFMKENKLKSMRVMNG